MSRSFVHSPFKSLTWILICKIIALTLINSTLVYAQNTEQPYILGINFLFDDGTEDKLDQSFRRMQDLNIKTARTDFEWRSVEPQKGSYNWSKIDTIVRLATKYNIEILPIVHYAPEWALPKKRTKPNGIYQLAPSPNAYKDYARFLNAAIDRYGPSGNAPFPFNPILYWQIWNEPNTKEFWYIPSWNMNNAAGSFSNLMSVVAQSLENRRKNIKIVHAGLSKNDITYMWFLWDKNPEYGRLFDVMAVHSYFFNPKGGVRDVNSIDADDPSYAALGFIGGKDDHGFLKKALNVSHFLSLKKSPKPLWITEIGFMANQAGAAKNNPWIITEEQEAIRAAETLGYIGKNLPDVERVYWFTLSDYTAPFETGTFGIYRKDGHIREGLYNVIKQKP